MYFFLHYIYFVTNLVTLQIQINNSKYNQHRNYDKTIDPKRDIHKLSSGK